MVPRRVGLFEIQPEKVKNRHFCNYCKAMDEFVFVTCIEEVDKVNNLNEFTLKLHVLKRVPDGKVSDKFTLTLVGTKKMERFIMPGQDLSEKV
jgi:hypothetical protein